MEQNPQPDNETEEREQTMGEEMKGAEVLEQVGSVLADMAGKSDEELEQALNEMLGEDAVKVLSIGIGPIGPNDHSDDHPPVEIRSREKLSKALEHASERISDFAKAVLDERFDGRRLEKMAMEWSDYFMSIVMIQTQDHAVQDYKSSPNFLRDVLKVVDEFIEEQKEKEQEREQENANTEGG